MTSPPQRPPITLVKPTGAPPTTPSTDPSTDPFAGCQKAPTPMERWLKELPLEVMKVGTVEVAIEALGFDKARVMTALARGAQLPDTVLRIPHGQPYTHPTSETDDRACFLLYRNVSKALASYERSLLATVQEAAASGDTSAARWLLEKQFPHRYQKGAKGSTHPSPQDAEPADLFWLTPSQTG